MTAPMNAPPRSQAAELEEAEARPLLTREQSFALARLEILLERRDAVDAERLIAPPDDRPWLVRALDAAIVSYYRLAAAVGVGNYADLLLRGYRYLGLGGRPGAFA